MTTPPSSAQANHRPGVVTAAVAIAVLIGLLMLLSGFGMTRMQWSRPAETQEELDYMNSALTMVRTLGVATIVLGVLSAGTAVGMLRPRKSMRTAFAVLSGLALVMLLLGWIFSLVPTTVAMLAIGLALSLLLVFRPAARQFYDVDEGTVQ